MPLSRSAIPLCCLVEKVLSHHGFPNDVVAISLPLNIRGESRPIVHCVRHRRTVGTEDQYAGTQQNMNQEYINLTRGVEKTCMWVERQPFGYPGFHCEARREFLYGGSCEERCSEYAKLRNMYIKDSGLKCGRLESSGNVAKSYWSCFKVKLERDDTEAVTKSPMICRTNSTTNG